MSTVMERGVLTIKQFKGIHCSPLVIISQLNIYVKTVYSYSGILFSQWICCGGLRAWLQVCDVTPYKEEEGLAVSLGLWSEHPKGQRLHIVCGHHHKFSG